MLIATAGHVDHGKTSLIRALTGVNTDRLDEEKRRGLSIELGFAFKDIDGNSSIGFIDVPGHSRFMNTMISGITGIDLAMLIVAADDGPMPQTLEHLQILRLLGVKDFLVIISKIDLVDEKRVEEVFGQIWSLFPDVQICKISTKADDGIAVLKDILVAKAVAYRKRKVRGHFRMYIDRTFTKKGSGLVVTGTALSGNINIGDELFLHTVSGNRLRKTSVKVRDIHAQGNPASSGSAGQRCALNIVGSISVDNVARGDFLCADTDTLPALRLDSRFELSEAAPRKLKHLGRVKLYIGSRRIGARAYLLSGKEDSGRNKDVSEQRVQFILDIGVIASSGDRFLIREESEKSILGGGVVIDPVAPQRGRANAERARQLDALEKSNAENALENLLFENDEIVSLRRQQRIWNITNSDIQEILRAQPFGSDNIVRLPRKADELVVSRTQWNYYKFRLKHVLTDWHSANSENDLIAIDKLQALLGDRVPLLIFSDILAACIRNSQIVQSSNQVRLSSHKPKLTQQAQNDWSRLDALMKNRLPLRSEIEKELGFDTKQTEALTRTKLKTGKLFEIGEKRLALPSTLRTLADQIVQLPNRDAFTVIDAKKAFDLGRNQTIEVLEFFDALGFSVRNGNTRSVANADVIDMKLGGSIPD